LFYDYKQTLKDLEITWSSATLIEKCESTIIEVKKERNSTNNRRKYFDD
jgi:hypothetical protein